MDKTTSSGRSKLKFRHFFRILILHVVWIFLMQEASTVRAADDFMRWANRNISPCQNMYQYVCNGFGQTYPPQQFGPRDVHYDALGVMGRQLNAMLGLLDDPPAELDAQVWQQATRFYRTCQNHYNSHKATDHNAPFYESQLFDNFGFPLLGKSADQASQLQWKLIAQLERTYSMSIFMHHSITRTLARTENGTASYKSIITITPIRKRIDQHLYQRNADDGSIMAAHYKYLTYLSSALSYPVPPELLQEYVSSLEIFQHHIKKASKLPVGCNAEMWSSEVVTLSQLQRWSDAMWPNWINWQEYLSIIYWQDERPALVIDANTNIYLPNFINLICQLQVVFTVAPSNPTFFWNYAIFGTLLSRVADNNAYVREIYNVRVSADACLNKMIDRDGKGVGFSFMLPFIIPDIEKKSLQLYSLISDIVGAYGEYVRDAMNSKLLKPSMACSILDKIGRVTFRTPITFTRTALVRLFSELTVTSDNHYENSILYDRFRQRLKQWQFYQPERTVSESPFSLTSSTADSYLNRIDINVQTISSGVDFGARKLATYGGLGSFIAQKQTESIQGAHEQRKMPNDDLKALNEAFGRMSGCLFRYYKQQMNKIALDSNKTAIAATMEEKIAQHVAVQVAYQALLNSQTYKYSNIADQNQIKQQFFISFIYKRCTNNYADILVPYGRKQVRISHEVNLNSMLANMNEFSEVFQCKLLEDNMNMPFKCRLFKV